MTSSGARELGSAQPSLVLSTPQRLFSTAGTGIEMNEPFRYEVDAAGQRFLMMREVAAQNPHTAITVVQNWFAEFKKKK